MTAIYSVQTDSEDEARERLADMCRRLDLRPVAGGRPMQSPGRKRWLARAEPEPTPDVPQPARRGMRAG